MAVLSTGGRTAAWSASAGTWFVLRRCIHLSRHALRAHTRRLRQPEEADNMHSIRKTKPINMHRLKAADGFSLANRLPRLKQSEVVLLQCLPKGRRTSLHTHEVVCACVAHHST